ncbi:hypothetical protein WJR50_29435 [Catalinimonas sp. 4WD22]|uniref:hypothetical protein n=1 Tax=Catalinimonas locisalis TaxID=3133978 RepID=UPI0031010491
MWNSNNVSNITSNYSKACILILVLPDICIFMLWVYFGQQVMVNHGLYLSPANAYLVWLLWVIVSYLAGLYNPAKFGIKTSIVAALLVSMSSVFAIGSIFIILELMVVKLFPAFLVYCFILSFLSGLSKLILIQIYYYMSKAKSRRFIIIGYKFESKALLTFLKNQGSYQQFLGYFDDEVESAGIRKLQEVKDYCRRKRITSLYVCGVKGVDLNDMYEFANKEYIQLYYLSADWLTERRKVENVFLEDNFSILLYKPSLKKYLHKKIEKWVLKRPNYAYMSKQINNVRSLH